MFGSRKEVTKVKARFYVLSVGATVVILAILSLVIMVGSAAAGAGTNGLFDGPYP